MSGNNNSKEKPERQFDEEQYQMLLRCSENEDITEWNEWRKANKKIPILLEGANLSKANLKGADLSKAHLEGANLSKANLEGAYLWKANLEGVRLLDANLEGADLSKANLKGADLSDANLEGTVIKKAILADAIFKSAIVDGKTLIWDCNDSDSEKTDFTGVGLDSARISPILKERLKNNIRKMKWQDYCHAKAEKFQEQKEWKWWKRWWVRLKRLPVLLFWQISNYGSSTTKIVYSFFICAFIFAWLYYFCGLGDGQGIIANLFVDYNSPSGNAVHINPLIIPLRALYFSIVTMTTLGFGDMYALSGSYLGHIALMFQVLLGYILLGALIVRFGILFISSGPSQD